MNKRGLSTIVVSLAMIIFVLIAAGVMWVVIRNLLEKQGENVSVAPMNVDVKISSVSDPAGANNVQITTKRNPGAGTTTGIKYIIQFNDGTFAATCDDSNPILELVERTYTCALGSKEFADIKEIKYAPIIDMGDGKTKAGLERTYKITP